MDYVLKERLCDKDRNCMLERKLVEILISIGISANLQGYNYLKESIRLVIKNPTYVNAVTTSMYPNVAKKYNTTPYRVERSIRHALDVSYNKGKMINLNNIFGLNIFSEYERPTNSEFVALVADRLAFEFN